MNEPELEIGADWPRTTRDEDPGSGREWIHETAPRYFLHRYRDTHPNKSLRGNWVVIDRISDEIDGVPFSRKSDCIEAFAQNHGEVGSSRFRV
jgi:hypothetical protein